MRLLNRFIHGTLGDRVAVLWSAAAFVLTAVLVATETGPAAWLAGLQADYVFDGVYYPKWTFIALFSAFGLPGWPIGKGIDAAFPAAAPSPGATEEASSGGFGLLVVAGVSVGLLGASLVVLGLVLVGPGAPQGAGLVALTLRDLRPGEAILAEDLALVEGVGVPGAVAPSEVVGRVAREALFAGDAIVEPQLAARGRPAGAASLVPSGLRALWIPVGEGMAGLGMEPGDRVDAWSISADGEQALLAEGLLVVAIEPSKVDGAPRATLAASSGAAPLLSRALSDGALHLALRSDLDFPAPLPEGALELPDTFEQAASAVYAARALPPGHPIEAVDLVLLPDVDAGLAGGAPPATLTVDDLVGAVPHRVIYAGERVRIEKLADQTVGRGVAALLSAGERGVSVSLGDHPLEMFQPGTRVDIVASPEPDAVVTLREGAELLGLRPEGAGCPCAILRIGADDVAPVLAARATGALGLRVP